MQQLMFKHTPRVSILKLPGLLTSFSLFIFVPYSKMGKTVHTRFRFFKVPPFLSWRGEGGGGAAIVTRCF